MSHCNYGACLRCDIERAIEQTKDICADRMPAVACVLSVLLGAMSEGSETELAVIAFQFSRERLAQMDASVRVN